jgi:hypothetical protein
MGMMGRHCDTSPSDRITNDLSRRRWANDTARLLDECLKSCVLTDTGSFVLASGQWSIRLSTPKPASKMLPLIG